MAQKNNTAQNISFAVLALLLFMPKGTTAAPSGGGSGAHGNGYTPVSGTEGDISESYLGIPANGKNRGIRNNNPGNIKFNNSNPWTGKIPASQSTEPLITDAQHPRYGQPVFEQFTAYPYGIRAMIHIIKNSYIPSGRDTIKEIMNNWTPGHSNDHVNYISAKAGKNLYQAISPTDETTIKKIIQAIARYENGQTATNEPEVITDLQYQTARNIL